MWHYCLFEGTNFKWHASFIASLRRWCIFMHIGALVQVSGYSQQGSQCTFWQVQIRRTKSLIVYALLQTSMLCLLIHARQPTARSRWQCKAPSIHVLRAQIYQIKLATALIVPTMQPNAKKMTGILIFKWYVDVKHATACLYSLLCRFTDNMQNGEHGMYSRFDASCYWINLSHYHVRHSRSLCTQTINRGERWTRACFWAYWWRCKHLQITWCWRISTQLHRVSNASSLWALCKGLSITFIIIHIASCSFVVDCTPSSSHFKFVSVARLRVFNWRHQRAPHNRPCGALEFSWQRGACQSRLLSWNVQVRYFD